MIKAIKNIQTKIPSATTIILYSAMIFIAIQENVWGILLAIFLILEIMLWIAKD